MRWLFIIVIVLLVACVLSIVWMNDAGDSRLEVPPQPQPGQPALEPPLMEPPSVEPPPGTR